MNSSLFYQTQTYFQRSKHKNQYHSSIKKSWKSYKKWFGLLGFVQIWKLRSFEVIVWGWVVSRHFKSRVTKSWLVTWSVEGQTKEEMRLIQLSDENNIKKLEKISQYVWRLKQIPAFIDKLMSAENNKLMRPHMQEDIFLRFLAEEK